MSMCDLVPLLGAADVERGEYRRVIGLQHDRGMLVFLEGVERLRNTVYVEPAWFWREIVPRAFTANSEEEEEEVEEGGDRLGEMTLAALEDLVPDTVMAHLHQFLQALGLLVEYSDHVFLPCKNSRIFALSADWQPAARLFERFGGRRISHAGGLDDALHCTVFWRLQARVCEKYPAHHEDATLRLWSNALLLAFRSKQHKGHGADMECLVVVGEQDELNVIVRWNGRSSDHNAFSVLSTVWEQDFPCVYVCCFERRRKRGENGKG